MIDYLAAAVACGIGFAICYLNYCISKRYLAKNTDKFYVSFIFRQAINVALLVAVYFIAPLLGINQSYALIGAALGITLPSAKFTRDLLEFQKTLRPANEEEDK